ncbi:NAD(P)-binding domain-containing protein [Roseibium sp. MMSF_3544]|uniref:NAD(P)-binding domain-containing protein n=1 Tax=unclassified Roseibium TaxID=2629323 RepID=UPI00273EC3F7|nr:NAD(P)-binding domain-containing protein [Roseibium sp. MMSF_3544]
MKHATVIVVGAGQSGLAMSRALSRRSIDHVVLERGTAGQSWRSERWDSLRLLTPNWANGLPGAPYNGLDPDGFMASGEMANQLFHYAETIAAPILCNCRVSRCSFDGTRYRVDTSRATFTAEVVVIASGAAGKPHVPAISGAVPGGILQITPDHYRRPADLPDGKVLVVGAAATGVQLARELHLSGRPVTLSVGSHVRLPRTYRGKDIEHWLDITGVLDQSTGEIDDVERARRIPAPQLVGGGAIDLNSLQDIGVEIVGRFSDVRDGKALFSGGLAHVTTAADLKMNRTLDLADDWVKENGLGSADAAVRPGATSIPRDPRLTLDLEAEKVRTILWATGFRPDFSWLDLPVFDLRGRLRHEGGVCGLPGLYVLGLPFLRRRRSHQISGAEADSTELAHHVAHYLDARRAA